MKKHTKHEHEKGNASTTTDCEEVTDSLAQLSTSSMHKKRSGKPSSVGKRRRTQANKRRKRNEKYQQELKAAADEKAAASKQDDLNQPMLGRFRPDIGATYSSEYEQPSTSTAHQHSCDTTFRRDRLDVQIDKVQHQQRENNETEYAGTFVRKNSKQRYYSAKTYYPRPTIRTFSTSEDSDFDSDQEE